MTEPRVIEYFYSAHSAYAYTCDVQPVAGGNVSKAGNDVAGEDGDAGGQGGGGINKFSS